MDATTDCMTCPLCPECSGFGFRETFHGDRHFRRDCDACEGRGVVAERGCAVCDAAASARKAA
jgi:DnaJ-class molecular chaperone